MNRMLLYKKIYLRRSLSLAVCFTVLFVAYSAVSVYLETAAAYGEALASLKEPQQLSFSVRMLYGGARIFLLILFFAIGAYSHADKIRQSKFLFRFGYSRFRIFRVNACVTFLELLIPERAFWREKPLKIKGIAAHAAKQKRPGYSDPGRKILPGR